MLERKRENDHLKFRINNDFAFQKENFIIQKNESGNVRNEPQSYLINNDVNSFKKSFCESLDNSNPKLNNKININDKLSFDEGKNNEIKVLKNKKKVYIKQVLIMINNKKYYKGSYLSEDIAARIYDIMAIKYFGIKARTNFIFYF